VRKVRTPRDDAAAKGRAIVAERGLRGPEDLDIALLAASYGVYAVARPLALEEGHVLRGGEVALATIASWTRRTPRWRWVLAHELWHKLMDGLRDDFARCMQAEPVGLALHVGHRGPETSANDFAGEVLMPEAMFAPRWRAGEPTLARVVALATVFNTTVAATALRALLFTSEACAVVCSRGGRVLWCASSVSGFGVKLAKGDPVPDARALDAAGVVEEAVPYDEDGCGHGGDGVLAWWRGPAPEIATRRRNGVRRRRADAPGSI
jgi:hypothetical protein